MFKRKKLRFKQKYELSLISCGDSGEIIGRGIIHNLEERGAVVKSLLITSGEVDPRSKKIFSKVISIDDERDGFSKKLDESLAAIRNRNEELLDVLESIIPKKKDQLLIVTTGAGATGLGSSLHVLKILYENYKLIPPVFTLLPEVFENSRVQYNSAMFLYEVLYKKGNYGNAVIILDNKPSIEELDVPFSDLSENRLSTIPSAIGDLLFASFQKSIATDFEASEKDLLEVIHTPGISVFIMEELRTEGGADSTRLESIIADNVIKTTSLNVDQVFEANNAYITISNIDPNKESLSFQIEFEAKKLFKEFTNRRPFVKFIKTHEDVDETVIPMLHAIVAGLPQPPRVIQIMQLGRDARKDVIFNEYLLDREVHELDIDKVTQLERELNQNFRLNRL